MQVVSGVAGHLYAPLEPRHAAVLRVGAYNRPFHFLENEIFAIMGLSMFYTSMVDIELGLFLLFAPGKVR